MKKVNQKKIAKQICDYLGEDFDSMICKEVRDHLALCPTCKIYFDTVKKTVTMCKENEKAQKVPDEVSMRYLKC